MFAWNVGISSSALPSSQSSRRDWRRTQAHGRPGLHRALGSAVACGISLSMRIPHFIVVERGITTAAGPGDERLWTMTTYLLLAAWYYESVDRATRSTRRCAERTCAATRNGGFSNCAWAAGRRASTPRCCSTPWTKRAGSTVAAGRGRAAARCIDRLPSPGTATIRQAQSTLEREVALALAFARILRTRKGQPVELEVFVEPAVSDTRFPPMIGSRSARPGPSVWRVGGAGCPCRSMRCASTIACVCVSLLSPSRRLPTASGWRRFATRW